MHFIKRWHKLPFLSRANSEVIMSRKNSSRADELRCWSSSTIAATRSVGRGGKTVGQPPSYSRNSGEPRGCWCHWDLDILLLCSLRLCCASQTEASGKRTVVHRIFILAFSGIVPSFAYTSVLGFFVFRSSLLTKKQDQAARKIMRFLRRCRHRYDTIFWYLPFLGAMWQYSSVSAMSAM